MECDMAPLGSREKLHSRKLAGWAGPDSQRLSDGPDYVNHFRRGKTVFPAVYKPDSTEKLGLTLAHQSPCYIPIPRLVLWSPSN